MMKRSRHWLSSILEKAGFIAMTVLVPSALFPAYAGAAPMLEAVSNRADLVSGGDVLLRVRPAGAEPGVLSVNGTPLPGSLHAAPDKDGFLALVTGLKVGTNTVSYASGGKTTTLPVTNYPIGGPIFSGPHLKPWACTTQNNGLGPATDADCNAPTTYAYFYKKAGSSPAEFLPYDPAKSAPADLATTTTDQGKTVPYIVRVETGTINRSIYKITVLFDPASPWTAWNPQPAWNGKVLQIFVGGAASPFWQGPLANNFDDNALSRGFATMSAGMMIYGTAGNIKLNAEAVMMLKERLAEAYGPIRYSIAMGGSGGAIQQHGITEQYPGLIDGLIPVRTYPDAWSLVVNGHDCMLLSQYFLATSPTMWTNPAHRIAVNGHTTELECPGQDGPLTFGGRWFPATNGSCQLPPSDRYSPFLNPRVVRCTFRGYHVNVLGTRPDGLVNEVMDNVGV